MTKQTIKRIINFVAFVAVVASSALVLIAKLIPSITDVLLMIAGVLCFLVCVFAGGYFALSRRNGIYIALLVMSVLIAVLAFIIF